MFVFYITVLTADVCYCTSAVCDQMYGFLSPVICSLFQDIHLSCGGLMSVVSVVSFLCCRQCKQTIHTEGILQNISLFCSQRFDRVTMIDLHCDVICCPQKRKMCH